MPNPVRPIVSRLVTTVGLVGSLFIKRDADGRVSFALAPLSIALVLTTSITCSVQKTEPFSVCVRDTVTTLRDLIHAN